MGKGLSKDEKAQKLALQHWLEAVSPFIETLSIPFKYSFLKALEFIFSHYVNREQFCVFGCSTCGEKKRRAKRLEFGYVRKPFSFLFPFPPQIPSKNED